VSVLTYVAVRCSVLQCAAPEICLSLFLSLVSVAQLREAALGYVHTYLQYEFSHLATSTLDKVS